MLADELIFGLIGVLSLAGLLLILAALAWNHLRTLTPPREGRKRGGRTLW